MRNCLPHEYRKEKSFMSDSNLTKADKKIEDLLSQNPDREYTIPQIANQLNYSKSYIRNRLSGKKPLLQGNRIIKIKKGNNAFFRGLKKIFSGYIETLQEKVNNALVFDTFSDLYYNKVPLGIHSLNLIYRKDPSLSLFYDSCGWKIAKGNSKQKIHIIKGKIEDFGKTTIKISRGDRTNKPSIQIVYNGSIGGKKRFLTRETYPLWYDFVDQFLRNSILRKYGLSGFQVLQIELNMDVNLTDKSRTEIVSFQRSVRMYEIGGAIEFYPYEDEEGGIKGRIGKAIDLSEKEKKISRDPSSMFSIQSFFGKELPELARNMDYALNVMKDVKNNSKANKSILNTLRNSIDLDKQILKIFPDVMDDTLRKMKSNLNDSVSKIETKMRHFQSSINQDLNTKTILLEKELKTKTEHMGKEVELMRDDFSGFKSDLSVEISDIKDTISSHQKSNNTLFQQIGNAISSNAETNKNISTAVKNNSETIQQIQTANETNYQNLLDLVLEINRKNKKLDKRQEDLSELIKQVIKLQRTFQEELNKSALTSLKERVISFFTKEDEDFKEREE
jgi:hypothetical protein